MTPTEVFIALASGLAGALLSAAISLYISGEREKQKAKMDVLKKWAAWGGFTGYYGPRTILGEILVVFNDSPEVRKTLPKRFNAMTLDDQIRVTRAMCKNVKVKAYGFEPQGEQANK